MPTTATKLRGTRVVPHTTLVTVKERDADEFMAVILDFPVGDLAQASLCTKEAAKGWKAGRSMPSASSLLLLAQELPTVRRWVLQKIERERGEDLFTGDPEVLHAFFDGLTQLASQNTNEGRATRALLAKVTRGRT